MYGRGRERVRERERKCDSRIAATAMSTVED
jgi:hypothetical protein